MNLSWMRRLLVPDVWVVNSSPMIMLAKIGRLDFLHAPGRTRISAAAPPIQALRDSGLRLSHPAIADAVWRYLGETWEP